MASKQFATTSGLVSADTSATGDTAVLRDGSGHDTGKIRTAETGLVVGGYTKVKVTTKTSSFTVDEVDAAAENCTAVVADTTSGSITITLPAAATSTGRVLIFVKTVAANSLILDGNASETIAGATTKTATAQYASYSIVCDGSNWHVFSTLGSWS